MVTAPRHSSLFSIVPICYGSAMSTTIRVSLLQRKEITQGGLDLIASWSDESDDHIWVDITDPVPHDIEPLLEEWFRFHELATEDSLSATTQPKYDSFPRYDFLVFRGLSYDLDKHGLETRKLAAFLGKNFLVTIHKEALEGTDSVWTRLPMDRRLMQRGPDFLLYSILDVLVDSHFPVVEQIEERLDEIQEIIFKLPPSQTILDEVLHLKRDLNLLRRHTLPQRELFNQISRGDGNFVMQEQRIYFRDLYDHTFRIGETIDIERDQAATTMEAYLSVVANRTNDIMKFLTVFSTLLLPLNFIAGLYGMNFQHMPELRWHYGYPFALGLMLSIVLFLLGWFWKIGLVGDSKRRRLRRERRVLKMLRKTPAHDSR